MENQMRLFQFKVTLVGTIQAENFLLAADKVKSGLTLALPLHDAVDDLVINVEPVKGELDDLSGRFSG